MRKPLSVLLLLAALAAAPASYAAQSAPLKPVLVLARTVPAFKQSLINQIQLVTSLSAQAVPSLVPLTAPTAAMADPYHAETARIIGALVAQPEALAAHQEELRAALGDHGVDMLQKASARLQNAAAASESLRAQFKGLSLDASAVEQLGARLNSVYEKAKLQPETSTPVAVPEGASKTPLVTLSRSGERPAMAPAELEAYVNANSVVSPRGLKRVNFASGDYRSDYDAALRGFGVDQVVIKGPSRFELSRFKEEDGYHLKSEYVRWVMTTRTLEEHEALLSSGGRKQFKAQLKASEEVPLEIGPLTVEKFEQWYPIYEEEVVGKPGGKRNVALDFARKLAEKGDLAKAGWYGLFYYDALDPARMIGGVIMKAWPERGMFVLGYAAYREEAKGKEDKKKDLSLSVRTFVTSMKLARELGFKVLSFGQDTNFFGYDYTLGLMHNKAGFLLTPYPEDEIVLLKMLTAEKIAAVKNRNGHSAGYLFFGINRESPLVERYLDFRESQGKPKEAQELLGGNYFTPEILPAAQTTVVRRFKGDDPNLSRTPIGIPVVDGEMK